MTRLVALYSPAPGSGKSTVAQYLQERHSYVIVKFASPLKDMLRTLLRDHCGIDHRSTEQYVDGDLKERTIPELGVTSRRLQQTLGTEWGRNTIRDDLWVHITRLSVQRAFAAGRRVVIDDMRFPNELALVEEMGGVPIRVVRPDLLSATTHASEGGLDSAPMATLLNDGGLADLFSAVERQVTA